MLKHKFKTLLLILIDVLLYFSFLYLVVLTEGKDDHISYFISHLKIFGPILPAWIVIYYIEGMYTLRLLRKDGLAISIVRSQLLTTIVSFLFFYIFTYTNLTPKTNLIAMIVLMSAGLFISRKLFLNIFSRDFFAYKVLVIGEGTDVDELVEFTNRYRQLGLEIKSTKEFSNSIDYSEYDSVLITHDKYNDESLLKEILKLSFLGIQVNELSKFSEIAMGKVPVETISSAWFVDNEVTKLSKGYSFFKSILDKTVAIVILVIFLPIFAILLPFLLIFSGRPIFYSQLRTGLNNKPFRIYKLRTMTVNAEKSGAQWATPGDARVTRIGKFLRVSRLDEIPQIWNILNGDMSIVGPRPERPEIISSKLEKEIPHYSFRHFVKPGVTGWAQVNYGYGYSERDSLIKLQYDLYYVKRKSIWLDVKIILKTIKTVITGVGH